MALALSGWLVAVPAHAQRASENAVASADDAFGSQLGKDQTGIYNQNDVRGFSAVKAGNVRIEGIYFDQFAFFQRTIRSSAVRIGAAALDYPFPAPTGIADRSLKLPGNEPRATVAIASSAYGALWVEADTELPLVTDRLSIGVNGSYEATEFADGARLGGITSGIVGRYRHTDGEVIAFVDFWETHGATPPTVVVTPGPYLPPLPRARNYVGQSWSRGANHGLNGGVIVRQKLTDDLSFRGGIFRSGLDNLSGFSEIVSVEQPDGTGTHMVVADPKRSGRAYSGEAQIAWNGQTGNLRHRVIVMARGRDKRTETGGSQFIDLGPVQLGQADPEPQPVFTFGPMNVSQTRQTTGGLGYVGQLGKVQLNLGLQKTSYRARYASPAGVTRTSDSPWLYNATISVKPTPWLEGYATYVTGLEESGIAPESAANRNELLPASRTRQVDAGIRLSFDGWRIATSVFDIRKPYFTFDGANRFVELGSETHRGVEASVTKQVGKLNLLAGAVLMDPTVSGPARNAGLIGKAPVGITPTLLRLDADYQTPFAGLAINGAVLHTGKRAASAQGYAALAGAQLYLQPITTLDLGARYTFKLGQKTLSVRANVFNLFNQRVWTIAASNAYIMGDGRRFRLQLVADL